MVNEAADILEYLQTLRNEDNIKSMARFGISAKYILGISIPVLRDLSKHYKNNHLLSQELWTSGIHEARLMAIFIDDPKQVTEKQAEEWVAAFESWDICDQCCNNLFSKTTFAYKKAFEWAARDEEFVRRAAFTMMAVLAVHDKKADNETMMGFLPLIENYAFDNRNFVKKAVNWALRQIGKRNLVLNKEAVILAARIKEQGSSGAKWIASNALLELTSDKILSKIKN